MAYSIGLLVLRVATGLMMAFGHGWEKLLFFSEKSASFADPLGVGSPLSLTLAVFAEFFCSLLVALGVTTRLTALPPLVTMVVAAFVVHADDPWAKKELALLYAISFLVLLITGGGSYSLDSMFGNRRRRTRVEV